MRRFWVAVLSLSLGVACGYSPNEADELHVKAPSSEVRYIRSPTEFADGIAAVSGSKPFRSVGFVVTAEPTAQLQIQAQQADGSWSEWKTIEFSWQDELARTGHVVIDAPSTALRLKSVGTTGFVRLELFPTEEEFHDDDDAPGAAEDNGLGELNPELRQPGMWQIPKDIWDIGQKQYLPYTEASKCEGGLKVGSSDLAKWLLKNFKGPRSYGGYNCRNIAGTSTLSVHASGRAIDVMVPIDGKNDKNSADNDLGNPVGNWLVAHAEYVGISLIIWDQASWGAHRSGNKQKAYTGSHPHNDHLHIELTPEAAARKTKFFVDNMPAPTGAGSGPVNPSPTTSNPTTPTTPTAPTKPTTPTTPTIPTAGSTDPCQYIPAAWRAMVCK